MMEASCINVAKGHDGRASWTRVRVTVVLCVSNHHAWLSCCRECSKKLPFK
jgi:hypothetical protein